MNDIERTGPTGRQGKGNCLQALFFDQSGAELPPSPGGNGIHLQDSLKETTVVGSKHYDLHHVMGGLCLGEFLILKREPGNCKDKKAIEVFTSDGFKLGYLPKADNIPFAKMMDRGALLVATIVHLNLDRYDPVDIRIFVKRQGSIA